MQQNQQLSRVKEYPTLFIASLVGPELFSGIGSLFLAIVVKL